MSNLFILLVPWNFHSIKFLSNSNQGSYKCNIISLFNFNFNFIALVSFFRKVWDKSDPWGTWEHGEKRWKKTVKKRVRSNGQTINTCGFSATPRNCILLQLVSWDSQLATVWRGTKLLYFDEKLSVWVMNSFSLKTDCRAVKGKQFCMNSLLD